MRKSLVSNHSPLWAACFAAAVLAAGGLWADEPANCPLQSACRAGERKDNNTVRTFESDGKGSTPRAEIFNRWN